jgi:hypothetical protein
MIHFIRNYAEGGAMGGSDRTFKEQFERYSNDLKAHDPTPGVGLYLIWFGLNLPADRNLPNPQTAVR